MTTLIAVFNSEGCVGRCDAKCYEAIHPDCNCVCGGMNHGAGKNKAMQNTTEMAEQWIEEYSKQNRLNKNETRWEIPARDPQQLTLF